MGKNTQSGTPHMLRFICCLLGLSFLSLRQPLRTVYAGAREGNNERPAGSPCFLDGHTQAHDLMWVRDFKVRLRPSGLPIVLESAAELTAAEGNDGIGSAHGPKHT